MRNIPRRILHLLFRESRLGFKLAFGLGLNLGLFSRVRIWITFELKFIKKTDRNLQCNKKPSNGFWLSFVSANLGIVTNNGYFQLKKLYVRDISIDDALLRFILSNHCVDKVEWLGLFGCKVSDQIVEKLAEKIEKRTKKVKIIIYFNRFACFWPKGYQLGSLGKSHQNGYYLKQAMRKIVFPQESNLQRLDYRSTALPLELEKTPPRMLNFGYLNPATCLLYDCNNKSIKMFF